MTDIIHPIFQDIIRAHGLEPDPMRAALADAKDDTFIYREALKDLLDLHSEYMALNGGGPNWQTRWRKALSHASELFEP